MPANLRVIQPGETDTPPTVPSPQSPSLWRRLVLVLTWLFTGKTPEKPKGPPRAYTQLDQMPGVPDMPRMELPSFDIEKARKKSLMHQQKILCSGESSGHQCKHYWKMVIIPESANPEHLREGETFRWCTYLPTIPHNIDDGRVGAAVKCNRYEPDLARPYDEENEEFRPLTPAQIRKIQQSDGVLTEEDLAKIPDDADEPAPKQTVSIDEALSQEQP